jgi:hypothetical protein
LNWFPLIRVYSWLEIIAGSQGLLTALADGFWPSNSTVLSQRFIPLSFSVGTGSLTITAPVNANLAPPGNYMLFIVGTNGVPSVAAIIQI